MAMVWKEGREEGRDPVCFKSQTGTTFLKDNLTVSMKLIVPVSLNQRSICGNLSYRNTQTSIQRGICKDVYSTIIPNRRILFSHQERWVSCHPFLFTKKIFMIPLLSEQVSSEAVQNIFQFLLKIMCGCKWSFMHTKMSARSLYIHI